MSLSGPVLRGCTHRARANAAIARMSRVCALPSGQFPGDLELDVKEMEVSPGVRRMPAVVEEEAPFEH
jgi:hypothetical protein